MSISSDLVCDQAADFIAGFVFGEDTLHRPQQSLAPDLAGVVLVVDGRTRVDVGIEPKQIGKTAARRPTRRHVEGEWMAFEVGLHVNSGGEVAARAAEGLALLPHCGWHSHISRNRKHVANYAQWRSQADLDAMMSDPDSQAHMREAAGIA